MPKRFDPLMVEIIKNEFDAITEEIALAIARTGRSPMVKVGDSGTAIADAKGRIISEGVSAFRVGVMMASLEYIIKKFDGTFKQGDIIINNDPYSGMGHMPDTSVVAPLYWRGKHVGFTLTYSHQTDIGGRFAGGMTNLCSESFEEGLRLPPTKLYEAGKRNDAFVDIVSANVRNPEEWFGDIEAKVAGCRKGEQQVCLMLDKYGLAQYEATCDYLQDHAERATRAAIREFNDGEYFAEDFFQEETDGTAHWIRIRLHVKGDEMALDFTGTSPQASNAINVSYGQTFGGVFGALRVIVSSDITLNPGFIRSFKLIVPPGTLLNPVFPAATGGRGPVVSFLMDLVFRVLAQATSHVGIAGESGDMIHFSGKNIDGEHIAFVDPLAGGWGARPTKDGIDAVAPLSFGPASSPPVELMERDYPIVIESFGIQPDTEGAGQYRGACAIYREWRFLTAAKVMVRSTRPTRPSDGLRGGKPGALSLNVLTQDGRETVLRPKVHDVLEVKPGTRLRHVIAGSGGFGDPMLRDVESVLADVIAGKLSIDRAQDEYGVAIDPRALTIDKSRTGALRSKSFFASSAVAGGN